MKRELSEAAKAAKEIRQFIKTKGIKARVTSKNYSMGNSVNVHVTDQTPEVMAMLHDNLDKYQYGDFNGMEDIYEYTNSQPDIPQTKYLFINNDWSDGICQRVLDFLRDNINTEETLPDKYADCFSFRIWDDYATTIIYRVLIGSMDKLSNKFWLNYNS